MTIRRERGRQRGFSLIEVLIALAVLAFGLLGVAMLQTLNLRYTQSANQRSKAVNLANELLDTVRANRTQVASYLAIDQASFTNTVPQAGCPTTLGALTPAVAATRWRCEVRESLGQTAWGEVTIPAAGVVRVQVVWGDAAFMPDSDSRVVLETRL